MTELETKLAQALRDIIENEDWPQWWNPVEANHALAAFEKQEKREAEPRAEFLLRNLLARIHRDGGQRQDSFATLAEAVADADSIVSCWLSVVDARSSRRIADLEEALRSECDAFDYHVETGGKMQPGYTQEVWQRNRDAIRGLSPENDPAMRAPPPSASKENP